VAVFGHLDRQTDRQTGRQTGGDGLRDRQTGGGQTVGDVERRSQTEAGAGQTWRHADTLGASMGALPAGLAARACLREAPKALLGRRSSGSRRQLSFRIDLLNFVATLAPLFICASCKRRANTRAQQGATLGASRRPTSLPSGPQARRVSSQACQVARELAKLATSLPNEPRVGPWALETDLNWRPCFGGVLVYGCGQRQCAAG